MLAAFRSTPVAQIAMTMHGTALYDHMPDSFLSDPAAWDGFVGQVWAAALAPHALPADGTAIEIAPGSSAKIAHALAAQGFHGTLHVVEASAPALAVAAEKYRRLLPDADLHFHAMTLAAALPHLPRRADMLLGSHILDDMLLHAQDGGQSAAVWASRYGNDIAAATEDAWKQLCADPAHLAKTEQQVATATLDAVAALAPQAIILSQYPSATLRDGGLAGLNDAALRMLAALEQGLSAHMPVDIALNDLPHYNNTHIGTHVLNPEYWLSCRHKA